LCTSSSRTLGPIRQRTGVTLGGLLHLNQGSLHLLLPVCLRELHLKKSGHYMYHTVVTICTAQWSLYVPHSGHYTYRTMVIIRTAQWSLYVPHSGHYMYRTVVTICTTSLTFNNSTFCPHTVFMCFLWVSEQTAIISLYNIN
jgi:hypothetical protein